MYRITSAPKKLKVEVRTTADAEKPIFTPFCAPAVLHNPVLLLSFSVSTISDQKNGVVSQLHETEQNRLFTFCHLKTNLVSVLLPQKG